ncbi:MAG TPA: flagellar biosynthesis protein FlhA [Methylomirabilota bacterium]|nr:flagellar biosynthesis protein FlhA [Methylomirabilota bacterium]
MEKAKTTLASLFSQSDLWVIGGAFATVLLLILPVPAMILDLLLTVSIALSLLILLVILYINEPSEFTGFPTLLLFVTLFRLALNVATTRLILLDGYAGHIVDAFGNFVVRGNFVVGLVVFAILVLINFIVITKGAGRIAEVAARFTLDALPGKQMAIDAELSAGVLTDAEAKARRRKVEQEADFYGAMDGASKFVRGDAIAAVLITLINIVGGFVIGVVQRGLPVADALQQYMILSIGDGLVSQIPALIVSMAAGLLVTRAASKNNLGQELGKQLLIYPRALKGLSIMLLVIGLVPGLPLFPFLILSIGFAVLARTMARKGAAQKLNPTPTTAPAPTSVKAATPEKLESLLAVETLQIELGYGLVTLADTRKGGDLLDRVTGVRKTFAQEMGMIIPPIRLRDNLQLNANDYQFLLKGQPIATGTLMPGHWLAMNASNSKVVLKGVPTTEPVFQLPATWVTDVERKNAELAGYTVVDAASVLVTHLSETVKRSASEILTRQDVQNLLDTLKQTHPTVVNELVPAQLSVGQIQRILQNLLAEGISIRNLAGILEKVGDYAGLTKNPDELSEHARKALGHQITKVYQSEGGLKAITLDPRLEQQIAQGVRHTPTEIALALDPTLARTIIDRLSKHVQQLLAAGHPPVVLCAPQIRLAFRRFFETAFSELAVLSYAEVPARINVQIAAVIPPVE